MRSMTVPAGVQVLRALEHLDGTTPAFCGGKGICGRCRVRITEGEVPVTPADRTFLTQAELADGWRLACRAVPGTAARVELPEETAVPAHGEAVQRMRTGHRYALAVCGNLAALVDLTAVTVVALSESTQTLLKDYPQAAQGLERTVTAEPGKDAQAALEEAIMTLFRER